MDITPLDITILVASTTGIILMSFAFPALGLTGDETAESDVPSFEITTDRFDFVGDFPSRPSSPDGGTMVWGEDNDKWITGGTSDGEFIFLVNEGNQSDPEWEVGLQDWDNDALTNEVNATINESERVELNEGDWSVVVELDRVYTDGGDLYGEAVYTIEEDATTEDSSWYSGIPIIGDTAEGLQWISRLLVYIGSIFQWFVLTVVEFIWNMAFVIIEVVTFTFGLASFLVNTYADVTTASGLASWAQVILLLPGILFMVEWIKLSVVFINTVWIG